MPGGFFRALARSLTEETYVVYTVPQPQYHNVGYNHGHPNHGPFAGPASHPYMPPPSGAYGPQPGYNYNSSNQQHGQGYPYQLSQQQSPNYNQNRDSHAHPHDASYGLDSERLQSASSSPPPPYSEVPTRPASPPTTSTSQPDPGNSGTTGSPGCSGSEAHMGASYCTVAAPGFDICVSCYDMHISKTCLADRFNRVNNVPGSVVVCDMSLRAVRDAWVNTCFRAATARSAQDRTVWLSQFYQQFLQIGQKLSSMLAQRDALSAELPRLIAQIRTHRVPGQSQMRFAQVQEAASFVPGEYNHSNSGIGQNLGYARLRDADQVRQEITTKQAQIQQLQTQIMAIAA